MNDVDEKTDDAGGERGCAEPTYRENAHHQSWYQGHDVEPRHSVSIMERGWRDVKRSKGVVL